MERKVYTSRKASYFIHCLLLLPLVSPEANPLTPNSHRVAAVLPPICHSCHYSFILPKERTVSANCSFGTIALLRTLKRLL